MAVSSIGRRRVLWAVAVITYFQRLGIAVRGQSRIHVAASLRAHCSLATMMPGQLFADLCLGVVLCHLLEIDRLTDLVCL